MFRRVRLYSYSVFILSEVFVECLPEARHILVSVEDKVLSPWLTFSYIFVCVLLSSSTRHRAPKVRLSGYASH